MNLLSRIYKKRTKLPIIIPDGSTNIIVALAEYETFLDNIEQKQNRHIQKELKAFCKQCGSQYTQEGLSHLYLMGPNSSYRNRMGNCVIITCPTDQGDALRDGKCPDCGCEEMLIIIPATTNK